MLDRLYRSSVRWCVAALGAVSGSAPAAVLTFDDVTSQNVAAFPATYGGLTFRSLSTDGGCGVLKASEQIPTPNGYVNTRVSGEYVAYGYQGVSIATAAAPFTLNDLYVKSAYTDNTPFGITGFKFDPTTGFPVLAYQYVGTTSASSGPQLVNLQWSDVARFEIGVSGGGTLTPPSLSTSYRYDFAFDDVRINESVPEPVGLAVASLGCVTLLRRRSKTAIVHANNCVAS